MVGSRVANNASSTSTPASVSRFSSDDFPALVYPAMETAGTALARRCDRLVLRTWRMPLTLGLELGDPLVDPPAVDFQLGLTRTAGADAGTGRDPATPLPGQRRTPAAEPWHQVVQLGQFDLRLALLGPGVLGEDVQDQRGPVDHLDPQPFLQVAQLAGGQLAVADHRVRAGGLDDLDQLDDLAGPDVGRAVGMAAALHDGFQDDRAGGFGQPGEFGHRRLRRLGPGAAGPDTDEHHPLELQLAVFDLGDVGEFGGQAGDAAQRGAVGQVAITLGVGSS